MYYTKLIISIIKQSATTTTTTTTKSQLNHKFPENSEVLRIKKFFEERITSAIISWVPIVCILGTALAPKNSAATKTDKTQKILFFTADRGCVLFWPSHCGD